LVGGAPTRFRSSDKGTRTFCSRCGTPLTFESDEHPDEIDITNASLDDPEAMPPRDHTRAGTKLRYCRRSQAAWARAANRVTRVLARGSPSSQCTTRRTFIPTAMQTCCSPVFASPM
jgi:Glutathione-dependent formaldehyde-activating enzyme